MYTRTPIKKKHSTWALAENKKTFSSYWRVLNWEFAGILYNRGVRCSDGRARALCARCSRRAASSSTAGMEIRFFWRFLRALLRHDRTARHMNSQSTEPPLILHVHTAVLVIHVTPLVLCQFGRARHPERKGPDHANSIFLWRNTIRTCVLTLRFFPTHLSLYLPYEKVSALLFQKDTIFIYLPSYLTALTKILSLEGTFNFANLLWLKSV